MNELTRLHADIEERVSLIRSDHPDWLCAKGCDTCNDSGYKGRVGLHELLVGSDPVKKLIQEKARVAEILACALNEGMRTLKMDGIEKVMQGITDIKQVRAVCIK